MAAWRLWGVSLLLLGLAAAAGHAAGAADAGQGQPAPAPHLALATVLATLQAFALDGLQALLHLLGPLRPPRRLLGVGLVPLFSRIDGKDILANPVRQRIHDAIHADPGLCTAAVQGRAGVAWGTAVYHLYRLERGGLVVSIRSGASRVYFAANTPFSRNGRELAALRHPTLQRIANHVRANPGINQGGLCRDLGLLNPVASKHLRRLELLGLVTIERVGRTCLYRATAALDTALGVAALPRQQARPQA